MIRKWLATASILLSACGAEKDPLAQFNYIETVVGRSLFEEAAASVDAILGPGRSLDVAGSWQPNNRSDGKRRISIYLLAPGQPIGSLFMFVPNDCGCIFAQPEAIAAWIAAHSTAKEAMIEMERRDAVAFMLLHELGHIVNGHLGQLEENTKPDAILDANIKEHKAREIEADSFAAIAIRDAKNKTVAFDGWIRAISIERTLINLSWNLSSIRFIDCFGCSTLNSPRAFSDRTYTHPNLEMRILTVNSLIQQNETAEKLLDDFLEHRRHTGGVP